ncbi:MAG TPA: hypothetical protein DIU07_14985 [Rhodobacteraceae bacterium]|nr:hypothetical protein [Paracoccaceae bacterium]
MKSAFLPVTLLAIIAAAPVLAAERTFDVSGFSEVAAGSGLAVEIVQGEGFAVTAEGTPRGLKRLEIDKRGDRLVIEREARGLERFSPLMMALADEVVVRVTLPELVAVSASAGSDVTARGSASDTFSAEASSGADLVLSGIDADVVTLEASSGSGLEAAGRCGALGAEASSGADLEARGLACDSARARASSGASIEITAATVEAEAQSGADVDVWGADSVEAVESSGGDVDVHQ